MYLYFSATQGGDRVADYKSVCFQCRKCGILIGTGEITDNPNHPLAQLLVGRPKVDHQVFANLPGLDHGTGGNHVQHHLLRVPRLQASGAGDDLWAGVREDKDVRDFGETAFAV